VALHHAWADGEHYPNESVFETVDAPERVVITI
jgi:hypothetical protein